MNNSTAQTILFCPYLLVDDDFVCMALGGELYRPSDFQQSEYCVTGNSRSCPFYSLAVSKGTVAAHVLFRERKAE